MNDQEIIEQLRGMVFDMLSALAYLRSINMLPKDFEIDKLETNARKVLDIHQVIASTHDGGKFEDVMGLPLVVFPDPPPTVVQQQIEASNLPQHRICPMCGDRGQKTVHLKRRPRGGLQCQACDFEYAFPAKWL
jgi:hypothetical protein